MAIKAEFVKKLNISSASGLIKINKNFYAVADDELNLIIFTEEENSRIEGFKLFEGKLPENPTERKKEKPDLESLVYISSLKAILAIPSGSKENRNLGVLVYFENSSPSRVQKIDFSGLFAVLLENISDLNIEGTIEFNDQIKLFQRGNSEHGKNSIISLRLDIFTEELISGNVSGKSLIKIKNYDLGQINGAPLAFTDAAVADKNGKNNIVFIAAAENTVSTYDDGEYSGAVIGCLCEDDKIDYIEELLCPHKPEGLWVEGSAAFIVTDADDAGKFSELYRFNFNL